MYFVLGVYLVPGGVLSPGVCLLQGGVCSGGCTWSWGVSVILFTGGRYLMLWGGVDLVRYLPPVNRMTNRCKNITLPQTSFAGGKNLLLLSVNEP